MAICPVCANEVNPSETTCPACGFKLAGSTQSFKPVQLSDIEQASTSQQQAATLRIVRGPQIGTIYTISDQPKSIGRNPQCDIFLNDMTVSREHATISMGKGGCLIEDNNSFNGLWVNDKSVSKAHLVQGDIVQIGVFCLVYELN